MTVDVGMAPRVVIVESDPACRRSLLDALGPGIVAVGSMEEVSAYLVPEGVSGGGGGGSGAWPHPHDGVPGRSPFVLVSGPSLHPFAAVPFVASRPGGVVVAVHGRGSTAELRAALAGGVGDLVARDAPAVQLRHAVRRAGVAAQVGTDAEGLTAVGPLPLGDDNAPAASDGVAPSGPVADGGLVAVLSPKGGTGGTTVAVNLALALASGVPPTASGPPVAVVVDADLQFGDAALSCGAEPGRSLASLARTSSSTAGSSPDATSVRRALVRIPETAVSLLAAPVDPAVAETLPAPLLGEVLDLLLELTAWVVVDLPAVIDDRAMEAIDRAGTVLVVASPDPLAVKDARAAVDLLDRLGLDGRWSVVCNAPSASPGIGVGALEQHLGRRAVISIPHDPTVPAAVLRGRALLVDAPASPAGRALASLAASLRTPSPDGGGPRSPLRDAVDRLVGGAWRARTPGR